MLLLAAADVGTINGVKMGALAEFCAHTGVSKSVHTVIQPFGIVSAVAAARSLGTRVQDRE